MSKPVATFGLKTLPETRKNVQAVTIKDRPSEVAMYNICSRGKEVAGRLFVEFDEAEAAAWTPPVNDVNFNNLWSSIETHLDRIERT